MIRTSEDALAKERVNTATIVLKIDHFNRLSDQVYFSILVFIFRTKIKIDLFLFLLSLYHKKHQKNNSNEIDLLKQK